MSRFKGQLVTRMCVTRGNKVREGGADRAAQYAQALDALRVQCYKEVTAASLARLAKIETSKGPETAVSLGQ